MEYVSYAIPTIVVIGVWWYDNLFLIKCQNFIKRIGFNIFWSTISHYTEWKETMGNEMIKDGYHIDMVLLYEEGIDKSTARGFDVTSVFRRDILKNRFQKFLLAEFVNTCAELGSNIEEYSPKKKYLLEIQYTFDYNKYTMYFDNSFNKLITFPLYTEDELRKITSLNSKKILTASAHIEGNNTASIEVTKEISAASGPLGNFYEDKGIIVLKQWVLQKFGTLQYNLSIIDCKGKEHKFKSDENMIKLN